jgi:hypothetical protein
VHQVCYGVPVIPAGEWYCCGCVAGLDPSQQHCELCRVPGGALKPVLTEGGDDDQLARAKKKGKRGGKAPQQWAHVQCATWIPETSFADDDAVEPVVGLENVPRERFSLMCSLCGKKDAGACLQCSSASCRVAFHPQCMLSSKDVFVTADESKKRPGVYELVAFCPAHAASARQRLGGGIAPDTLTDAGGDSASAFAQPGGDAGPALASAAVAKPPALFNGHRAVGNGVASGGGSPGRKSAAPARVRKPSSRTAAKSDAEPLPSPSSAAAATPVGKPKVSLSAAAAGKAKASASGGAASVPRRRGGRPRKVVIVDSSDEEDEDGDGDGRNGGMDVDAHGGRDGWAPVPLDWDDEPRAGGHEEENACQRLWDTFASYFVPPSAEACAELLPPVAGTDDGDEARLVDAVVASVPPCSTGHAACKTGAWASARASCCGGDSSAGAAAAAAADADADADASMSRDVKDEIAKLEVAALL